MYHRLERPKQDEIPIRAQVIAVKEQWPPCLHGAAGLGRSCGRNADATLDQGATGVGDVIRIP
jgi:hypothetical protein